MSAQAVIAAWNVWALQYGKREFGDKAGASEEEIAARLEMYIRLLSDIPDPLMEATSYQCLAQYDWFPNPHQVRETAAKLAQPSKLSAAEAWAQVQYHLKHRTYEAVTDPVIKATVAVITWQRLREGENEGTLFAQFRDTYDTLRARQREALVTPPIVHKLISGLTKQIGGQHGSTDAKQIKSPGKD
jgi:hypothetical protein